MYLGHSKLIGNQVGYMVYQFWHMYPGQRYAHTTPVWDLYGLENKARRVGGVALVASGFLCVSTRVPVWFAQGPSLNTQNCKNSEYVCTCKSQLLSTVYKLCPVEIL